MVCITHTLGCNQIKLRPKLMFWWNVTLTLHWAVCHSVTAPPGMGRFGRIIVGPGCGCSFLLREGGQWTLPGSWHLHYIAHTLHPTIATLPTLHVSLIRYYNIKLLFDGTVLNIKPAVQWEQALLLFICSHTILHDDWPDLSWVVLLVATHSKSQVLAHVSSKCNNVIME